jgi:hypothetical protein
LGGDGLALALFLGGDAEIEGDRHAHRCGSVGGKKQVALARINRVSAARGPSRTSTAIGCACPD